MDGAPRVARSPPPSPCRRLQSSLVLLVVVCHLLVLAHDLWTAVSGCDTEEVFVNTTTTTTEPSRYTEHCWNETCFAKCCADQQGIASSETFNCSDSDTEFDSIEFVTKVMSTYQLMDESQKHNNISSDFFLFYNQCDNYEDQNISRHIFTYNNSQLENYNILVEGTTYIYKGMTDCVDFVVGTDLIVLLGCSMPNSEYPMTIPESVLDALLVSCMIVSTVAISLVLAVYLYLPQLQGPHRNILLCYLVHVMALHPTVFLTISHFEYTMHFFNLAVFLGLGSVSWLTVMSYDIWSTFSRPLRPRSSNSSADPDNHKFLVYSLVGWGYPITHLLLYLYVKCVEKMIMFKSIALVVALNLVLFLSTVVNIRMLHSIQTDVHNSHRHNHTQQGVLLYVKLSLLMGVDWVIFVSSWAFDSPMFLGPAYMLLESQGTFMFVLLVCNRRVLRLLRNKWNGQQSETS